MRARVLFYSLRQKKKHLRERFSKEILKDIKYGIRLECESCYYNE